MELSATNAAPRRYAATIEAGGRLAGVREMLVYLQRLGFSLAILLVLFTMPSAALAVALATSCLWIVLGLSQALARRMARATEATIGVEGEVLVLREAPDRERAIPLQALRSGRVLGTKGGGARVVLRSRWGQSLVAHLADRAAARSLLRDLKLSARDRPATFAFFFGLRVTVGADGILMAWPLLRRRRFVPYAKIVSTHHSPGAVVFRLSDGGRYEVMTTTSRRAVTLEQHDALVERIEEACTAYRATNDGPPLAALARGGRSALGWVKDLRALSETSGSGYRAASLPSDALWAVALDPTASEELRIGAGLALRGALDDEGRVRLHAAAEASASPKLRVVLEEVAEGAYDERLGEAIENKRLRR